MEQKKNLLHQPHSWPMNLPDYQLIDPHIETQPEYKMPEFDFVKLEFPWCSPI